MQMQNYPKPSHNKQLVFLHAEQVSCVSRIVAFNHSQKILIPKFCWHVKLVNFSRGRLDSSTIERTLKYRLNLVKPASKNISSSASIWRYGWEGRKFLGTLCTSERTLRLPCFGDIVVKKRRFVEWGLPHGLFVTVCQK